MDRIEATRQLSWYFNVAVTRMGISAMDPSAIVSDRPGWQYSDPNIAIASRAKPIRHALLLCSRKTRKILELAFTETSWRSEKDHQGINQRHTLWHIFGDRLAPLIKHYRPGGEIAYQRTWAESILSIALRHFMSVYADYADD